MAVLKKLCMLVASLMVALASWGSSFETWQEMYDPQNAWVGIGIIGGVLVAWLGQSPIKPKQQQ